MSFPAEPPTDGPHLAGPPNTQSADAIRALVAQVNGVVLGNTLPVQLAAAAFVGSGHVLFEDSPGVGKTLLSKALAASVGGTFGRIQGTPDLLPSDLTGISYLDDETHTWVFRPGPLFNNVVLVDELNRATPRTQSALLEAMAEGQVTVDGVTHALPDPFFVVATQNPRTGDLGTFPLVGGQRDRFSLSLSLGLPGRAAELDVLAGKGGDHSLAGLRPTSDIATWRAVRREVGDVFLHPEVARYALDVVDSIRAHTASTQPLSPRASLALVRMARATALADGRSFVAPDDIKAVAVACLSHRIIDVTNDDLTAARTWVGQLLDHLAAPPRPTS